jgi:hypothetical protein
MTTEFVGSYRPVDEDDYFLEFVVIHQVEIRGWRVTTRNRQGKYNKPLIPGSAEGLAFEVRRNVWLRGLDKTERSSTKPLPDVT